MHLGENHYIWYSKPICIENCLKTVSLKNFHGYKSEICFLKCVLKTACALERMDIRWSETYLRDLKRKTKARKELEKIERSSTAFVIKFSWNLKKPLRTSVLFFCISGFWMIIIGLVNLRLIILDVMSRFDVVLAYNIIAFGL